MLEKYGALSNEELLKLYHGGELNQEEREWIKAELYIRVFFILPYAVKKAYHILGPMFNDAMQNMSLCILQAIENFDPHKGPTFVNYLAGYLKSGLFKTFRDAHTVRVPFAKRKTKGEEYSLVDEPAKETQIQPTKSKTMDIATICIDEAAHFDEQLHNAELVTALRDALSKETDLLDAEERRVLIMHYGLFGSERQSYRVISRMRRAEGRGYAYSRISQIHAKAIGKLRQYFEKNKIEEF